MAGLLAKVMAPGLTLMACVLGVFGHRVVTADEQITRQPLFRVADLNVGQSQELQLSDGSRAKITLLGVEETRDKVRSAIRLARVKVKVNDVEATIESGNYRLPVTVGDVQIDCPATLGLYLRRDLFEDSWGLDKDARLRLWPKGSPWIEPGSFGYPIKQVWFGNVTQAGNEPSYVMGEDAPTSRNIYYHAGNDIGGVEGFDEVVAASDGLVISTAGKTLPEYPDLPFYQQSSYATVYVLDEHGWIYRYTHMKSIDAGVRLGERIKLGQLVGRVGKEEGAGYYAHLHFDIKSRKPSGKWGVEDAYAFLWEAYRHQYNPPIIAVARPHHLTWVGESVTLDGSRSWSASGEITQYEWTFGDGQTVSGPQVERKYDKPGRYSEILKVTDGSGEVAYDFAIVDVIERGRGDKPSAGMHAAYFPSLNIRPADDVTFVVRTAGTTPSGETWDFGDGYPLENVRSDASTGSGLGYAEIKHSYARPGHYLVRVQHTTEAGYLVTMRLHVLVERYVRDVSRWQEVVGPPESDKGDRMVWAYSANYSNYIWHVFIKDGRPHARPWHEPPDKLPEQPSFTPEAGEFRARLADDRGTPTAFAAVDDGWLVGFNDGEFGGALYWFSDDGERSYKISDHQVVDFVSRPDGIYAVEGFSHFDISNGSVIRIDRPKDGARWQATPIIELPSAPFAVSALRDGTMLIILYDALVSVGADGKIETLLADAPWGWAVACARSSVLSQNEQKLYIGMGQFVGEFDLTTKKLRLFMPPKESLIKLTKEEEQRIRKKYGG